MFDMLRSVMGYTVRIYPNKERLTQVVERHCWTRKGALALMRSQGPEAAVFVYHSCATEFVAHRCRY
jgi:hypothetical protein